jgi:8-amino-7-oxononanoate synthase
MLDFTSALYLGLRHPTGALRPWRALSSGRPAALDDPEGAAEIAQALASLMGCERGTLLPSTLHAFWDLFTMLEEEAALYLDAGTYAVVRWGAERAAARGRRVRAFAHHDPEALRAAVKQDRALGLRPTVVTDGFCTSCGRAAPVRAYLDCVRAHGGRLIVDDTQALGILGERTGRHLRYGRGGGGTLRWSGVPRDGVVLVASLAKGFGVPVAALVGSGAFVRGFERRSDTRVHCSPPSAAAVRAAEHALSVNARHGEELRARLARRIDRFRARLAELGWSAAGALFPIQTVAPAVGARALDPVRLHEHLWRSGVRAVLHRARGSHPARVSFLLTVRHTLSDLDHAVAAPPRVLERRAAN